jgi:Bacterial pre-peptidase C-terminal domain
MKSTLSALIVSCVLLSTRAWSIPYAEIGDVGETLGTAQAVSGGVTTIVGDIVRDNADLFSFYWNGGALTLDTAGSSADTQLFLFNAFGQGVWANDEAVPFPSSRIVDAALAAGQYFIGLSMFDFDPYSNLGAMFPSAPFTGQFGPSNLAPLDHWARFSPHLGAAGSYVINFSSPTAVPEPPMLILIGTALLALGFSRRRALVAR